MNLRKTSISLVLLLSTTAMAERLISPLSAEDTLKTMECPAIDTSLPDAKNLYKTTQLIYTDRSSNELSDLIIDLVIKRGRKNFHAEVKALKSVRTGGNVPLQIIEGQILTNDNGTVSFENLGTGTPSVLSLKNWDHPAFDIELTNQELLDNLSPNTSRVAMNQTFISTFGQGYQVINPNYKHPCDEE